MKIKIIVLIIVCALICNGCTVVTANRAFPKLDWYWSKDAKQQRQYKQ